MNHIPIIDFSLLSLDVADSDIDNQSLALLSEHVIAAFHSIGFLYIKNYGIGLSEIEDIHKCSSSFFNLSNDVKNKYSRGVSGNHGWVSFQRESLNPERPPDLKEAFNIVPEEDDAKWPTGEATDGDFKQVMMSVFHKCVTLALRILKLLAIGLCMDDADFFTKAHERIGKDRNATTMRSLFYPELQTRDIKENQLRCGEHSDYGSITLLFGDGCPGLQVMNRSGEYIDVSPRPGCILVNIGDLMQRWTSDKLLAAKHRVLVPSDVSNERRSLAFFVHPDDEVIVKPHDGGDKYEPISAIDYVNQRFSATY